ncbi:MAG: hypothetical protein R3F43_32575 [bacterium]
MLRWAFREARWRLAVGGAIALTTPAWLPDAPSPRLWSLAAFALLAPWLVLGRDARRVEADLRTPLASTRGLPRWVAAELAPPLLVVAAGALVGTGLDLPAAAPLFAWGAFLVCLADALDRRSARAGAAWVGVLVVGLVVLAAPLWVAGWLGGLPLARHPRRGPAPCRRRPRRQRPRHAPGSAAVPVEPERRRRSPSAPVVARGGRLPRPRRRRELGRRSERPAARHRLGRGRPRPLACTDDPGGREMKRFPTGRGPAGAGRGRPAAFAGEPWTPPWSIRPRRASTPACTSCATSRMTTAPTATTPA